MSQENLSPDKARQGEKTGHVRYILLGSLIGAVVALIAVGIFS
jgi:hypothetical protein